MIGSLAHAVTAVSIFDITHVMFLSFLSSHILIHLLLIIYQYLQTQKMIPYTSAVVVTAVIVMSVLVACWRMNAHHVIYLVESSLV